MKTSEELNKLRAEVELISEKIAVLSEEELNQVTGGIKFKYFSIEKCPDCGYWEFMLCNRQLKVCPKCGSTNIRRLFGI